MKKILVFAKRDWSFKNIEPALKSFNYDRITSYCNLKYLQKNYSLIITCEPHMTDWFYIFTELKLNNNTSPILAMQQGMYYTESAKPGSVWSFDKIMCWGEQTYKAWSEQCELSKDRIIITGNPRHDAIFNLKTKKTGKIVILESGNGKHNAEIRKYIDFPSNKYISIPHPNSNRYIMNTDTIELLRVAKEVFFTDAGPGIWALIMNKKCNILGNYDRYKYHEKDNFIKWSVTGDGATQRVKQVIKEHIGE